MRRLPGILAAAGAILIVLVALVVSGLRMALPTLDYFRPQVVAWVQSATGLSVELDRLSGRWETFGPTLEIENLRIHHPDADWRSERISLALDVWQSLLHAQWKFRDLTFYRLQFDLNTPLDLQRQSGRTWQPDRMGDLFLRQFDHFDLRDSQVTFQTPAGNRAVLSIPQLTWLNSKNRHRAEGQISLSSFNGQHGVVQVRMDLRDEQGWLNNGTVYLQADKIDMKPWLSRWVRNNTGLESADFSLAAWLNVREGDIHGGDLLLQEGSASWRDGATPHRLDINRMTVHASRYQNGWMLDIPALNMATDGARWPAGKLAALWLPADTQLLGPDREPELRIRGSQLDLERVSPLLPLLATTTPALKARWDALQPRGRITALALDIPLQRMTQTRFLVNWRDAGWKNWQSLPGGEHVSGSARGSMARGQIAVDLRQSTLPYQGMFRAPLEIRQAGGTLNWSVNEQGWDLWANGLDVQARSLWVNGDFHYHQPAQGEPRLDILAGIRLQDAADAWRYYPEPFMGKALVDYLSTALKSGYVDNATLVFAGNPHDFPFEHQEGQFQVWVPLERANFEFEPGWPALDPLNITLNFMNNGLWMQAPSVGLGNVEGRDINAVIADYSKEKLVIDGQLRGDGKEVSDYFVHTPLKGSLGNALSQVQIGGEVLGDLHLDIPLNGGRVRAGGNVVLGNNSLYIKPLDVLLQSVAGQFHYDNGNLVSQTLKARWLEQPLTFTFSTQEQEKAFLVNVGLLGRWQPSQLPGLPSQVATALKGNAGWQSAVQVTLPYRGIASYDVSVQADLKEVSSHLPSPLNKAEGEAMTLQANAKGDVRSFELSGSLGKHQRFNSRWLLRDNTVTLERAAWQQGGKTPSLPDDSSLTLTLPALDGERWLALLPGMRSTLAPQVASSHFRLPDRVTLSSSQLKVLGQQWHDVVLTSRAQDNGNDISVVGRELDGRLFIPPSGEWRGDLRYLYYNPQWQGDDATNPVALAEKKSPLNDPSIRFEDLPALRFSCAECWVMGLNVGKVKGSLLPEKNRLLLSGGVVDSGKAKLTLEGSWQENGEGTRTALKGRLSGDSLTKNSEWLGVGSPLRAGAFTIDYDLYWHGSPWAPDIPSLSGILKTDIGKGEIVNVGAGQAGQLLRLISFDALLRKMQFDFSDTFGKGFYFDSVRSTAWIKDGILHTDNLLVDGLEADIAMKGDIDLVKRQITMDAVVAPEISATVGVATAFVVNPVVGAAVFAASKVLAPLWNKISLIRYQISGSVDQPKIQEVVREAQKAKSAEAAK
ncbi:AsmA2 domain-containing protein YhdP [Musicola paradisiaca]|uniref:YhdP central domain-containing protein n=1 Tax=Musicola paradisiaca (strain Ech703) TaxID=579405 RepID=C6C4M2_MUSP7|nr:AsmA2 domain-containing protein YhdP [Musicola paradisiaca]ACS87429.1 conserved hypothetical protein [Musicola paradisiaca Ech703]